MSTRYVRIKKGVRPYAGRVFEVDEAHPDCVTVNITKPRERGGGFKGDLRVYRRDEVEFVGRRKR